MSEFDRRPTASILCPVSLVVFPETPLYIGGITRIQCSVSTLDDVYEVGHGCLPGLLGVVNWPSLAGTLSGYFGDPGVRRAVGAGVNLPVLVGEDSGESVGNVRIAVVAPWHRWTDALVGTIYRG